MSATQDLPLLQSIVSSLDSSAHQHGPMSVSDLENSPFFKSKLGLTHTIGIRKEAGDAFSDLASSLFDRSPRYLRGTTFSAFFDKLADVIINDLFEHRTDTLTATDLAAVELKLEAWLNENIATHEFYIPCSITPWPATPLNIGGIQFMHGNDFIAQEIKRQNEDMLKATFGGMVGAMQRTGANWVATVAVADCMAERAQEIANLAVDIALSGLQLIVPLSHSKAMARMTSRAVPNDLQLVSRKNGSITASITDTGPGIAMGPHVLDRYLSQNATLLSALGQRVAAYLQGGSMLPDLDQAWADAAYWFHEALGEPLDTVAVPKLETSIEILLRAENTSGSKSRVLKAIEAFHGLTKSDVINPTSQLTVEKFATGFVTDRSRILHGTWSTLNHSLRESRPSLTTLARGLLSLYAAYLEGYLTTSAPADNADIFITYVNAERQKAAATQT